MLPARAPWEDSDEVDHARASPGRPSRLSVADREVRRQTSRVHLRPLGSGCIRSAETKCDSLRHQRCGARTSRAGVQLRRLCAQVRARQGSRDGLHGQGHPRRGHSGQDHHPRVTGGRGDPRRRQAPSLSERPEAARDLASAPRCAVRVLPEEGGSEGRLTLRQIGFTAVPPGTKPGFDHADTYLDPRGSRLYVAHTGADRVDVVDCKSGAYLRSIAGLPGVAGVLIDSEHDLLFTSDRAAARVSVLRASEEAMLGQVAVDPRPNGLAFDPDARNLYSLNLGEPAGTNCTASVVSVDARRVVATLQLPGRPRWAVFDGETRCVYANISEPASIVVIDADSVAISRSISVPAAGPHGLALVAGRGGSSLWCAADGGQLVVLDPNSRASSAV